MRILLAPEDYANSYEPLGIHSGISPNFNLVRMNWKLVYRKSGGLKQQAHSYIYLWTFKEKC